MKYLWPHDPESPCFVFIFLFLFIFVLFPQALKIEAAGENCGESFEFYAEAKLLRA